MTANERFILARQIESLNDRIEAKREKAARIKERLSSPIRSGTYNEPKANRHDVRRRERELVNGIDEIDELERQAAALQPERDRLCDELRSELSKTDYKTRSVVRARLIYSCSWQECAELNGYSSRWCMQIFDNWINKG